MKIFTQILIFVSVFVGISMIFLQFSNKINEVTAKYIKEKCDKNGNIIESNLNPNQQKGLKSLKKSIREKGIVAQTTDKGGDMAVNTPENYIETMKPHTRDPEISWEEHKKLEAEVNAYTIQFARVLRVGAKWNHCTMLDQGPPCFGHLAKSPFLVNVLVLAKLIFKMI